MSEPTPHSLLERMNRQFNVCNALYHAVAVRCGMSDTTFWVLYDLYYGEPKTQNQLCSLWALPKQTLNSAVAAMTKQGLLSLTPVPGQRSGKLLALTEAGRTLAEKTVCYVHEKEEEALKQMGTARALQMLETEQEHLQLLRRALEEQEIL